MEVVSVQTCRDRTSTYARKDGARSFFFSFLEREKERERIRQQQTGIHYVVSTRGFPTDLIVDLG